MLRTGSFGLFLILALGVTLIVGASRVKAKKLPVAAATLPQANSPAATPGEAGGPVEVHALYHKSGDQTTYWEAWEADKSIIVHTGRVGDTGVTHHLPRSAASRRQVWAEAT